MSIFDRRPPARSPKPRRFPCHHCAFYSYDPDTTLGHMFGSHVNRRIAAVSPNPGRRAGDAGSPWVRLARAGQLPPGGALPPRN